MAFLHSTKVAQHVSTASQTVPSIDVPISRSPHRIDDDQEWILFSPHEASSNASRALHTPSHSRASELDSLVSVGASKEYNIEENPDSEGILEEDDEELDSLDDRLPAFQESFPLSSSLANQNVDSILPVHDGLGTFRTGAGTADDPSIQDRLWPFERFNSHRIDGRELHVDADEEAASSLQRYEKLQRIERWRIQQSQALLKEVEKETRKRRSSSTAQTGQEESENTATLTDFHDIAHESSGQVEVAQEQESFWERITRRIIKDVMGIDEPLLSLILGEEVLDDIPSIHSQSRFELSSTCLTETATLARGWEDRLLERMARELGSFANHFSDKTPTFSTYVPDPSYEYAGIPISRSNTSKIPPYRPSTYSSSPFSPTLGLRNTQLDNTEEECFERADVRMRRQRDREYWESDLSLKMVFQFFRARFMDSRLPSAQSSLAHDSSIPSASNTIANEQSFDRSMMIRRLHPLAAGSQYGQEKQYRKENRGLRTDTQSNSRCFWEDVAGARSVSNGSVGVGGWGDV